LQATGGNLSPIAGLGCRALARSRLLGSSLAFATMTATAGTIITASDVMIAAVTAMRCRRVAARRFNQVAWIAFAVLIVTGIWNVAAVSSEISHSASYRDTLIVKLVVVSISGITAALHARARSAVGRAVFGVLTGVSALAALFLGVLLAG
jgi:hypothetical protein